MEYLETYDFLASSRECRKENGSSNQETLLEILKDA